MKRTFIVNPYAGRGFSANALSELQEYFTQRTGGCDWKVARSRDAAIRTARESLKRGVDQVVAVGGDGTVNAVANGFFEHGKPIRPLSTLVVGNTGTGSDYFKTVVAARQARDWRQLVFEHVARPVDVGRIEYADLELCDQYFLNMASVGMIAEVVGRKNRGSLRLPRALRYVLPMVGCLFSYGPRRVHVAIDSVRRELEVMAISVAKGIHAGGGMRLGGGVTLCDGRFDVTLFGAMRPVEMLLKLGKLYSGRLADVAQIDKFIAARISVAACESLSVEFDGEVHGATDVEISVVPKAIRVCFPRHGVDV